MIIQKELKDSTTIQSYKEIMFRLIRSCYPHLDRNDISNAIDYSVQKRYKQFDGVIYNNYTNKKVDMTILEMCDYIASREPIITSYGTMFKRHGTVPNPTGKVIDSFLALRGIHKNEMFKYPKGSEMFERFNLIQNLDKIDTNGVYGLIGLYVSLLYNPNVAPSITSMGRSLISSAIMCFEMFLSNNVKFQSLNEILIFIDNVRMEAPKWKYDDTIVLGYQNFITADECFYKIMTTCGYKYIPSVEDCDIVWNIIQNCNQTELNRLYYKNNLYSFMDCPIMQSLIVDIVSKLKRPYMNPLKPPEEIIEPLNQLRDYLMEYVFYCYQIIDRMDRNKNMIKNTSVVSDTDSSFVSLDAWYHYTLDIVKFKDFPILHQSLDVVEYCNMIEKESGEKIDPTDKRLLVDFFKVDEFGDKIGGNELVSFSDPELDYDFYNDDIIEMESHIDLCTIIPQNNLKFTLINIMAYVLDGVINAYMIDFTKQSHSYRGDSECRILMKNEFYMYRILLMKVKKHYAALQGIQEGNFLGEKGTLDIKGIDCMAKSTFTETTRKELQKILLEDILSADSIDQLKIIKDMAIVEKKIYDDVISGNKTFYKPLTVKSASHYADPMREQGIKGSIAWNYIREEGLPSLDLRERNGLDIAKVNINMKTIEKIKDSYPEHYERMRDLVDPIRAVKTEGTLAYPIFKGNITSIAIPKDTNVPKWLLPFVDINQIISDSLSGFPLDSVGISKLNNRKNVVYTNMIKL